VAKFNKAMDRDYFKKRDNPKWNKKGPQLSKCCGENLDDEGMNVKNKKDWELIEEYIERRLREYSSTTSITPISCKSCGKFLRYESVVDINQTLGYDEKDN
tara:strand:+ start:42 stop:344 length:303 start_codon:yes stop_codon:yes gene_type:complete